MRHAHPGARLLLLLLLVVAPLPAFPQANITGVIKGYVTDAVGNFVPGATVTVTGPALISRFRSSVTDGEGYFRFTGIPVGSFALKAEVLGYQPYEILDIELNPGESRVFDIVLPEGLAEKVTVVAEKHVVDLLDSSTRDVLDANFVNRLPLYARRYQQILTLFPGVSNAGGLSVAQYHIDGSRVTQNGFRLDGATINDPVTGTFGLNVNQNSIERFELATSGFQAEYGEQSGGIANIVTKSGTNEFQFFYSGFYRGDAFSSDLPDADQVFAAGDADANPDNNHSSRPETQQWQEVAFSGPIVRDEVWFFTSFQYWQDDKGSIFNDSISEGDRYHGQFKVTWQASADNTLVANFATDPSRFSRVITDGRYDDGTNRDQTQGGFFGQIRDTYIVSPSVLLESQIFFHRQYLTSRPSEEGLGDFRQVVSNNAPVSFTGTWYNDQDRDTFRVRFSEAVTAQQGAHTLKAGLDYSFLDFTGVNRTDLLRFDLSPIVQDATGDPNAQLVYTYDYLTPESTNDSEREGAVYVQDTWKLNDHLTLQGGVRVDYQSLVEEANVAPRVGFTVDPSGRGTTKIYGNWGRYYDNIFQDYVEFQQADGTVESETYVVPSLGINDFDPAYAIWDYVTDGDLHAPYKTSWTVGVEQEFFGDLRVGMSTTQWEGKNQLRTSLVTDLNLLPDSVGPVDPAATAAILFDTNGRADYQDVKLYFRKLLNRNFELMGSYTRSRLQGNSSDDFGYEDRRDPQATAYTRLTYDRPDLINLSGTVFLPAAFELTGIYRYQSGRLFSPMVVSAGSFVIDPTQGKNSERMSPVRSFDLAVARKFSLGRSDLKLSLQGYNLTNELNVISVETFTGAGPSYGKPVEVDNGRTFQIGLELAF